MLFVFLLPCFIFALCLNTFAKVRHIVRLRKFYTQYFTAYCVK